MLAAVGATGPLVSMVNGFFIGVSSGATVVLSQAYGAGDRKGVSDSIHTGVALSLLLGVMLTAIGICLGGRVMGWMGTPENCMADATTYLRIYFAGSIGTVVYNMGAGILRAMGDSKRPMLFLMVTCILNVVLDLLFVLKLNMGVFGVGLATVISQAVSFLVSMVYAMTKVSYFRLSPQEWKPQKQIIRRCMELGIPMALQSTLISLSTMVLQGVVNGFGQTVMAAYTVVGKVEQLVQMPYSSLSTAITSFAGQNKGAGKIDRVKQGYKVSWLIVLGLSLALIPFFYLLGRWTVSCFVGDADVIAMGATALKIDCLFYFPLGMIYIPRGLLNGCGDARFCLMNGISEVICRVVFASVLTRIPGVGYWGVWLTEGLTWGVTSIVCILRYRKGGWQHLTLVQE